MVFLKFSASEGAERIKYPMWSGTDLMMKIAIEILKIFFFFFNGREMSLLPLMSSIKEIQNGLGACTSLFLSL